MKLKIFTLFLFFSLNSISAFAVVDVKHSENIESTSTFQNHDLSKNKKWFQRKGKKQKVKKRKFRLRDFFKLKKKFKKSKQDGRKRFSLAALLSLGFALGGSLIVLLGIFSTSSFSSVAFFLLELAAFILGIAGLGAIKRTPDKLEGKGVAWAGIIISSAWALFVLFLIVFFAFFYVD